MSADKVEPGQRWQHESLWMTCVVVEPDARSEGDWLMRREDTGEVLYMYEHARWAGEWKQAKESA